MSTEFRYRSARRVSVPAVVALLFANLAPAQAIPGDATATGMQVAVSASVASLPVVSLASSLSAATAPGGLGDSAGVTGPLSASGTGITTQVTVNGTTASRTLIGSTATADLAGASVTVLGMNVIQAATVIGAANCAVGYAPTASPISTGVSLLGSPIVVAATPATRVISLSNISSGSGLLNGSLSATVVSIGNTSSSTANATGIHLTMHLTLRTALGGIQVLDSDIGAIDMGRASCETPSASVPVLSVVTPSHVPSRGGTLVTLAGTGFIPGATSVSVDGMTIAAAGVSVNGTGTSASFLSPMSETTGPVNVSASTVGGTTASLSLDYDAPTIGLLTPTSALTSGLVAVTMTGSGFTGATGVLFGGVAGSNLLVLSDSLLTVTSPAHASGAVSVSVVVPGADGVLPAAFTFTDPAPVLSVVAPTHGPSHGGTLVTLTGTGFIPGATSVLVDGVTVPAASVMVTGAGTLASFISPASEVTGPVNVSATTGGGSSAALSFDYDAPSLGSLTPSSGLVGGSTTVTLTGSGFTGATDVLFGGVSGNDVLVLSDSLLTVTSPAHAAGEVSVSVVLPGADATLAAAFTFTDPVPTLPTTLPLPTLPTTLVLPTVPTTLPLPTLPTTLVVPTLPTTLVLPTLPTTLVVPTLPTTLVLPTLPTVPTTVTLPAPPAAGIPIAPVNNDDPSARTRVDANVQTSTTVLLAPSEATTLPASTAGSTPDLNSADGPAASATAPRRSPSPLEPSHGPLVGGNWVTLNGDGFVPDISVLVGGIEVEPANIRVASSGRSVSFLMPAGQVNGAVEVVIRWPNAEVLGVTYTFDPPTDARPASELAFTGPAGLMQRVALASALLGTGFVLVRGSRRKPVRRRQV